MAHTVICVLLLLLYNEYVRILFDVVNYAGPDSGGTNEMPDTFNWRKFGMLHEWGHNLGLEHHN